MVYLAILGINHKGSDLKNIAFFDFDGTITNTDTFTPFILKYPSKLRLILGGLILSPLIIGYHLRLVSSHIMRPVLFWTCFTHTNYQRLCANGEQYYQQFILKHLRKEMIQAIKNHRAKGDKIVLVSASLDVYLQPFCRQFGMDLICSEVRQANGKATGFYQNGDCSRHHKKQRILKNYNLTQYHEIFVYGDTPEDLEMLSLGHHQFYKGKKRL